MISEEVLGGHLKVFCSLNVDPAFFLIRLSVKNRGLYQVPVSGCAHIGSDNASSQ